jgi:hypothetical protein
MVWQCQLGSVSKITQVNTKWARTLSLLACDILTQPKLASDGLKKAELHQVFTSM